ncbi:HI1506-related protein [Motilimonas sp. 1_MG-2023]|uniref:HI1506-related protein n=1 Tax=Motilimonas sp. 1_MG-2023 TaxID=3062672 RepID=UPI0026E38BBA|nr:HI1506-related protein [Motilimonas sp. 1_MG-2023]MDO6526945.1 HI1506-related protein [Motilimonas sp. 1_MG-2023]
MDKPVPENQPTIRVFNAAHSGYRRANLTFHKGENLLPVASVSAAQLKQIQADSRLTVEAHAAPDVGADHSGAVDADPLGLERAKALDLTGCPDELAAIVALIAVADADGSLVLTSSNKPDIKALEALGLEDLDGEQVPLNISGAQRDAAWDWYQANQANAVTVAE